MRTNQIEDVVFGTDHTSSDLFWRIFDAFNEDFALQMLTVAARRALASTICEWMVGAMGQGRPNYTAVRVNLKNKLARTPFSVFGKPMHERVTEIVLAVTWPTWTEE